MTTRPVIVLDLESSGLDVRRHDVTEVAWWNMDTDEQGLFIPPHDWRKVVKRADLKALQMTHYMDRIAGRPQDEGPEMQRLYEQLAWNGQRATLAGANPRFDAEFLAKMFRKNKWSLLWNAELKATPWKHRLLDIEAYAMGVLGLDSVPSLHELCVLLGFPAAEMPDHSAQADTLAEGRAYRQLRELAQAQRHAILDGRAA